MVADIMQGNRDTEAAWCRRCVQPPSYLTPNQRQIIVVVFIIIIIIIGLAVRPCLHVPRIWALVERMLFCANPTYSWTNKGYWFFWFTYLADKPMVRSCHRKEYDLNCSTKCVTVCVCVYFIFLWSIFPLWVLFTLFIIIQYSCTYGQCCGWCDSWPYSVIAFG